MGVSIVPFGDGLAGQLFYPAAKPVLVEIFDLPIQRQTTYDVHVAVAWPAPGRIARELDS
jgi:hypothetical protein